MATAIMVCLCLVWGGQQVAIKAIAGDVDPLMQVGLRSTVAAFLVWMMGRWVMREAWLPGVWRRSGLLVGALFAAEFVFVAIGLRWTTASHMAVFLYTAPLFAAIGLHVRLPEERLGPRQWCGVALAFAGIAITFLAPRGDGQGPTDLSQALLGDAFGLCAGAAWGLTTVAVRASRLSEAPPTQTLFYQLLGAAVLVSPLAWYSSGGHLVFNGAVWASLAFQTLCVAFASYLVWFWMLRRYLAARLGIMAFMTPLFGVLLGVWLLDESITEGFALGAALSLAGLLIVNIKPGRRRRQGVPTPELHNETPR